MTIFRRVWSVMALVMVMEWGPARAQEAAVPEAARADEDGFLAQELRRVDPAVDGWESEVFHDAIKPLLSRWVKTLAARVWDPEVVAEVSPRLSFAALRPGKLEEKKVAGGFLLRRPTGSGWGKLERGDLRAAAEGWLGSFAGGEPLEVHTKIFQVSLAGDVGVSRVYVDVTGPASGGGRLQQNATWELGWRRQGAESAWEMESLQVVEFEEVEAGAAAPQFQDLTQSVLGGTAAWDEQLRYGIDHWRLRLETSLEIEPGGINGIALGDADGDGREDLFYTDSGGLPKRLFLHQEDGTLRDATEEAGLDFLDRSRAALFFDLDNDGDQDLAVALEDRLLIWVNDGPAKFTLKSSLPAAARVHGLAAADYDRDGLVDVYACSYGRDLSTFGEAGVPLPWDDARNGAPNALFRNEGGGNFRNVTEETGLGKNNHRFSFAACWEDVDHNGWVDLYVANDFGPNHFYLNDKGVFREVAVEAGVEDRSPGMACSWGDINGDGWMDLQVSNMFSGAGNRITFQPGYRRGGQGEVIASHQRFARGNSLYLNGGDGTFRDISVPAGITLGRWAWGHQMADINNDGWLDTLVGNGFITGPEEDDL